MNPGATAFTRMPRLPTSLASDFGEADDACLRSGIIGLSGIAVQSDDGGEVDDGTATGADQGGEEGGGDVEDALEIGVEDDVPLRLSIRISSPSRVMPALLTSTLRCQSRAAPPSIKVLAASWSATSAAYPFGADAFLEAPPRGRRYGHWRERPQKAMSKPRSASSRQIARPMCRGFRR